MRVILVCLLSLFFLNGNDAYAQLISDRPGISESSYVLNKNSFQLQSGLFSTFLNQGESNLLTNRFRFGLGNNFDVIADVNYLFSRTEDNKINDFSPLAVGVRKVIFSETNTNLGLQLTTGVPMSNSLDFLANNPYSTRFVFLMDHSISKLNLALNIGLLGTKNMNQYDLNSFYSVSASVGKTVSTFIEIFGNTGTFNAFSFQETTLNADTGIAYLLNESFLIDISAGVLDINKQQLGWILDFGLTWKINTED